MKTNDNETGQMKPIKNYMIDFKRQIIKEKLEAMNLTKQIPKPIFYTCCGKKLRCC